jgi:FkbM family methyltransferase
MVDMVMSILMLSTISITLSQPVRHNKRKPEPHHQRAPGTHNIPSDDHETACCRGSSFSSFLAVINRAAQCGLKFSSILDVGANCGCWSYYMKKKLSNELKYLMIEGNDRMVANLKATELPFEIALVGASVHNVTYYREKAEKEVYGTGNSVFRENTNVFADSDEVRSTVFPLDDLVKRHPATGPFQIMKLDIQGSELAALQGASQILQTVELIFAEISVMNYNTGAPSFFALHAHMESIGFVFYDIVEMGRVQRSLLNQFDAVWVKKSSVLWKKECTGFPVPSHFDLKE